MLDPIRLGINLAAFNLFRKSFVVLLKSSEASLQQSNLLFVDVSSLPEYENVLQKRFFVWQFAFVNSC